MIFWTPIEYDQGSRFITYLLNVTPMFIQKIFFGSPATGKSYQIREIAQSELDISFDEQSKILKNTVKTVFHPEYTYADFMGKLLPLTQGTSVIYKYYAGHFLRALGMAYRGLIEGNRENYLLIIDELNRGNAAAIFGTVFQLLDRESDGWSTYEVDISEMELIGLLNSMGYHAGVNNDGTIQVDGSRFDIFFQGVESKLNNLYEEAVSRQNDEMIIDIEESKIVLSLLKNATHPKIKIPPNLSIMATINTSDESIYYLDAAFKRRWDWEYVDVPNGKIYLDDIEPFIRDAKIKLENGTELRWCSCIIGLNQFIKSHHQVIRRIEDKQIGWWFIPPQIIEYSDTAHIDIEIPYNKVQDKLMFYIWDSVFTRDKRPLEAIFSKELNQEVKLVTYADFLEYTDKFIEIMVNIHSNLFMGDEAHKYDNNNLDNIDF